MNSDTKLVADPDCGTGDLVGSELEGFATEARCIHVAEILSMIANPKRLKILCLLTERDRSVDEIVQSGGSSISATSQQLKLLTLAGFLERRREGRNIFYRLKNEKILSLLHFLKSLYLEDLGILSEGAPTSVPSALYTKGA
ncbi:MAG: metalloregulator ArsR/SmtB family transcription factor [Treponema sp.]|nr:metalloregulator ArsR/SmtB family transcription factor [Treponema sp.]